MSLPRGSLAVTSDVAFVVDEAALAFDVPADDLRGPRKTRPLPRYRHVAMAAARMLGHSFPAIGREFGRDHSTVIHACHRVEADAELTRQAGLIARAVCERPRSLF